MYPEQCPTHESRIFRKRQSGCPNEAMTFPETLPHEKRADPKSEMHLVTTLAFSSVCYAYEYEKRVLARRIRSAFRAVELFHSPWELSGRASDPRRNLRVCE